MGGLGNRNTGHVRFFRAGQGSASSTDRSGKFRRDGCVGSAVSPSPLAPPPRRPNQPARIRRPAAHRRTSGRIGQKSPFPVGDFFCSRTRPNHPHRRAMPWPGPLPRTQWVFGNLKQSRRHLAKLSCNSPRSGASLRDSSSWAAQLQHYRSASRRPARDTTPPHQPRA